MAAAATRSKAQEEEVQPTVRLPSGVVKVTPEYVTPDEAAGFGLAGPDESIAKLLDVHRRLYPPAIRVAFQRRWDEVRTHELLEHLEELERETKDGGIGIKNILSAAVRGQRSQRVVTLTTRTESGRTHQSFISYQDFAKHAPEVHKKVEQVARVAAARERGLPWSPGD